MRRNSAFLCIDNRHPIRTLYQHFGGRVVFNMDRSPAAMVSFAMVSGGWAWPRRRNHVTMEIVNQTLRWRILFFGFYPRMENADQWLAVHGIKSEPLRFVVMIWSGLSKTYS